MSKQKILYDVECYYNCFLCSIKDYDTKEVTIWEISERKNDYNKIKHFFQTFKGFLISFNGIHYDDCMIMYLIYNGNNVISREQFLYDLKVWSDKVINEDQWWKDKKLQKYKYHNLGFIDVDLFLYWSRGLRISKKISLKGLGIQLNYPVVQELPYEHTMYLNSEQIDNLIHYNSVHDLGILEYLLEKDIYLQGKKTSMNEQVSIRNDAYKKYGFGKDIFSWDGVKLGLSILIRSYCNATGLQEKYVNSLRGNITSIKLKDIILDKIQFKKTKISYTRKKKTVIPNSFYSLLEHLKETTVYSTTDLDYTILYDNNLYDFKSGGLHTRHSNQIIEPDLNNVDYDDVDVSSYYPTLGAMYKFTPDHLPNMDKFLDNYRLERLKDKKEQRKAEERLKKLALNGGFYGNLNNEYSPMYSPEKLLSITINGQLFLLMLAEKCTEEGIRVDMANTDGITFIIPKEKRERFKKICNEWEKLTLMELEQVSYKKVIRSNINSYLAISTDGSIKQKGSYFVTTPDLGNSTDFLIVPKALNAYFVDNTSPEEFVMNHKNIYDFCASKKVDKTYTVYWTNPEGETLKQQKINRFYASTRGGYIMKHREGSKYHLLKDSGVQIYNEYTEEFPIDINYNFYLNKINEIIFELNGRNQLQLF